MEWPIVRLTGLLLVVILLALVPELIGPLRDALCVVPPVVLLPPEVVPQGW